MGVTLTYIGKNQRGRPQHFDTDDVGEALSKVMKTWYADGVWPKENSVFAVTIERDGHPLSRREVSRELDEIQKSESHRAHSREMEEENI